MTYRRFRYLDLEKLRVFHAVATSGSFSAAGKAINMSQPSVSGHVKDLERTLGLDLFERAGRGVRFTEAGEKLAGYAGRIFDLEAEASEVLGSLGDEPRGKVRVAASSTPGTYLLPAILGAFKKGYPLVEIDLRVTDSADALGRVIDHVADIGVLGSVPRVSRSAGIEVRPWKEDELVLIASKDHAWSTTPPRRSAQLGGQPFLMREPGSSIRAMTEGWLDERAIEVDVAMELGNPQAILNAVAAGLGVSVISRDSIRGEDLRGSVRVVRVPGLPIRRWLHVVVRSAGRPSTAASLLKETLLAKK